MLRQRKDEGEGGRLRVGEEEEEGGEVRVWRHGDGHGRKGRAVGKG